MKHIIILGDGMADYPVERLGGKTPLQYARPEYMNRLAKAGRCGRLVTVPEGFPPGSEVANTAILGYDLNKVYEGRGPLEAASIGYEMADDDFAIRCNIITLEDGKIITHNGGNLETEDARVLIDYLNEQLAKPINEAQGCERVKFICGIQYRHLLVIKGGNKHIVCAPPHDHPNEEWRELLPKASQKEESPSGTVDKSPLPGRLGEAATAALLTELILKSQDLLAKHPYNLAKAAKGERQANSIWPWSGGYRPSMQTLMQQYPQVKSGSVISAVDLIQGIGRYAGLDIIKVPGATGLADTNYEGKAQAAIEALKKQDFVFVHVEASDEAGHDGDLDLKLKTIENLDQRLIRPIYEATLQMNEPVSIAVLPDHLTPVEMRIHVGEPVPFLIYYKGIEPDDVQQYDEVSCVSGGYGMLRLQQFMQTFMSTPAKVSSKGSAPTTGIIGAVCGDIIGLPYELRADRTKDYNFPLKLNDFSDDTILTVAIAHWLLGDRSEDSLRQHYLDYALRFREKNVWGRGFQAWFESGGTIDRKGVISNGAAMRVTAIGYASDDMQEVLRLAEMSARMTHDSDEAARGAKAVTAAVLMARQGHSKDEIRSYIEEMTGYNLQRTVEEIRPDYHFEISCDRCVPESIICWLQSDSYEQAVRHAVSLGGDADTMAAIAGGIAAATPGMEVPQEWAQSCYDLLPQDFREIIENPLFVR